MKKMSIRMLMAELTIGALVIAFLFVLFTIAVLRMQLTRLVPPEVVPQIIAGLNTLLIFQAITIGLVSIILATATYLIISKAVVSPLRAVLAVMAAFAADGTRLPLPDSNMQPTELTELTGVLASSMDKVQQSHAKDAEISRVKSDFISTAAHQLRTPLTGIRWALEALEKDPLLGQEQLALVKSAVDKSHDLVAIVGTLLDISSIESGKYKYNFLPMDVNELVSEVGNDFTQLAAQRQVSLLYQPSAEALPSVKADRDRIKWILNNLIENAIRYTPSGGSITVSTESTAHHVKVKVRDTGIGIPEQERGSIFQRFYRAGNAITKENQGNGLGLYIARTIATDHGGDLDFANNKEGPGTTFILSFPIAA